MQPPFLDHSPRAPWLTARVASVLFAALFLVFWHSPMLYVGDSRYTLLLSHALLTRGSFSLDGYAIPRHAGNPVPGGATLNGPVYQLEIVHDHLYYYFPPGSAVLSAPLLAALGPLGPPLVNAAGQYDPRAEEKMQLLLASLLMAGLGAVFFYTARLLLPVSWSLGLALGGTLGTQIWSTASRALWTHTWGALLLGGALYLLLGAAAGRGRVRPVLLASLLSWTYFVRPTNSIFIIGITVYLGWRHRAVVVPYAAAGAAWFAVFVGYSWRLCGHVLPSYYQAGRLEFTDLSEALPGNLVSPSRGLLWYVPAVWVALFLVARYWRLVTRPGLVWLGLAVSLGHLVAVSCFRPWFGGHCYGPRYTTELVPWLFLLGLLGLEAMLRWREVDGLVHGLAGWRVTLGGSAALLLLSVLLNGWGAVAPGTGEWNLTPASLDASPWRVWNWRDPQGLAGWVDRPLPAVLPVLPLGRRLEFGGGGAAAFQVEGWSNQEERYVWTDGPKAILAFATNQTGPATLRLRFGVALCGQRLRRQRVKINLNGQRLASLLVQTALPLEHAVSVPAGLLRARNVLKFALPDATSPQSLRCGDDDRVLGLALHWLELDPTGPTDAAAPPAGSGRP